jgi:hypothetical protein
MTEVLIMENPVTGETHSVEDPILQKEIIRFTELAEKVKSLNKEEENELNELWEKIAAKDTKAIQIMINPLF